MVSNLAIIPARGGSKRIPGKNIKLFAGKPIISYSIMACLESELFEQVVVSTDSPEIAEIAQSYGARVPFLRDPSISDDHTGLLQVIKDAIERTIGSAPPPSRVIAVLPTSPFLTPQILRDSLGVLDETNCEYVFAAAEYQYPIQRALRQNGQMFFPEHRFSRSQDLEPAIHDAGQFYWGRTQAFLDLRNIFSELSKPFIVPREVAVDIDTPEDWEYAELLFKASMLKRTRSN